MSEANAKQKAQIVIRTGRPVVSWVALLGCVLVVLKVLGKITMPWWQVLLPFYWSPALIVILLMLGGITFGLIYAGLWVADDIQRNYRRNRMKRQAESRRTGFAPAGAERK